MKNSDYEWWDARVVGLTTALSFCGVSIERIVATRAMAVLFATYW